MAGNRDVTMTLKIKADIEQAQQALQKLGSSFSASKLNNPFANTFEQLASRLDNLKARAAEPMDLAGVKSWSKDITTVNTDIEQLRDKIISLLNSSDDKKLNFFGSDIDKNITKATKEVETFFKSYTEGQSKVTNLETKIAAAKAKVNKYQDNKAIQKYEAEAEAYKKIENAVTRVATASRKLEAAGKKATPAQKGEVTKATNELNRYIEAYNKLDGVTRNLNSKNFANWSAVHQKNAAGLEKEKNAAVDANDKLQLLENQLKNLQNSSTAPSIDKLVTTLRTFGITISEEDVKVNQTREDWIKFLQTLHNSEVEKINQVLVTARENTDKFKVSIQQAKDQAQQTESVLQGAGDGIRYLTSQLTYLTGLTGAFVVLKKAISAAVEAIKELDATMTETAVVTEYTVSDMWDQLPTYAEKAKELGMSINDVYEASTLYYQQGLNSNQVTQITTQTLKMARIAGLEAAEATDRMTAALRGFNKEINETEATNIADVYSKLAAITASDVDEISTAMSKVASLAYSANMSFENTAAFLAQIIETTRESAETAGTALKTVIARFAEIKENPTITTDSEGEEISYNKIDEALQSVGISLEKFMAGEEGLDEVFMRLSEKWDTLDTKMQRYIATQAAGSRQQSRFIALMQNYSRMVELTGAAYDSAGASAEQYAKTEESLETKIANLKTEWQSFIMTIANSNVIKGATDALNGLVTVVNKLTGTSGIAKLVVLLGSVIALGPALRATIASVVSMVSGGEVLTLAKALKNSFAPLKTTISNAFSKLKEQINSTATQYAHYQTRVMQLVAAEANQYAITNNCSIATAYEAIMHNKAMRAKIADQAATETLNFSLKKVLATYWPILAAVAAVSAVMILASNTALKRYTEQLEELESELEEVNNDLEETESKLEEIRDEQNEYSSQSNLSADDKEHLEYLNKEYEKLFAIKKLQQDIVNEKQAEVDATNDKKLKAQLAEAKASAGSAGTGAAIGWTSQQIQDSADEAAALYKQYLLDALNAGKTGEDSGVQEAANYLFNGGYIDDIYYKQILGIYTASTNDVDTVSTQSFSTTLENLTELEEKIESLQDAYSEFNDEGYISNKTISELAETFEDIDTTKLESILQELQNADDIDTVKNSIQDLAYEYVLTEIQAGKLTEENYLQYVYTLANLGVQVKSLENLKAILEQKKKITKQEALLQKLMDSEDTDGRRLTNILEASEYLSELNQALDKLINEFDTTVNNSVNNNDWESPLDKHYQTLQEINKLQQDRNKLESEYNALLEDNNASQQDIANSIAQQIANSQAERVQQVSLRDAYQTDLDELNRTNEYSSLIHYDNTTGKLIVNESGIESTGKSGGEKVQERLEELVEQYEAALDGLNQADDDIRQIDEDLLDWQTQAEEAEIDLVNQIANWLEEEKQAEIDAMQEQLDAEEEANDNLVDSIEKNLNRIRQDLKNQDTEQEIADKTRRLAYLRQDTSGSNALEIKKLEEELADMTEDYSDDLVDQALDDLKDSQETAIDQRQQQIDLLNDQLEWDQDHGIYKENASEILGKALTGNTETLKDLFEKCNLDLTSLELDSKWNELTKQLATITGVAAGGNDYDYTSAYEGVMTSTTETEARAAITKYMGINGNDIQAAINESDDSAFNLLLGALRDALVAKYHLTWGATKYASGGLADFTGPAWLDGTTTNPEVVLNARDSANFIELRDILRNVSGNLGNNGSYSFDININVDELANDYDVDSLANRIKTDIVSAMSYRNNNFAGSLR